MRLSVSVQRSGRTVVFARVQVTGADGELYAEASGVMSVRPGREARRALECSRLPRQEARPDVGLALSTRAASGLDQL
ncbi:hypothetical protein ACWCRF_33505 [Streptomyces sp. NPDC002405]